MNDVDFPVQRVLEGIDAAAAAGLPVKVNAVVKRGANDADLLLSRSTSAAAATSFASSSTWTSA
jgi:molybdenum cofactor biosynthesis enzyme MoaA